MQQVPLLDVPTSNGISSVKGGLGKCVDFWRDELCASPRLIHTIVKGYALPFVAKPTPYCHANQRSAIVEAEFVEIAIKELLEGGYVDRVTEQPHVCSPISVVSSGNGMKRLVVNLRHVNRFLLKQSCKYEEMRLAISAGWLVLLLGWNASVALKRVRNTFLMLTEANCSLMITSDR